MDNALSRFRAHTAWNWTVTVIEGEQAAESLFPEFYYGKSGRGNYNRILKLNPEGEYNFAENKYI